MKTDQHRVQEQNELCKQNKNTRNKKSEADYFKQSSIFNRMKWASSRLGNDAPGSTLKPKVSGILYRN